MMSNHLKVSFKIAGVLLFFAVVILFFSFRLDRYFSLDNIEEFRKFILTLSYFGVVISLLLFVVFGVFCLPTFFFIIFFGYIYGALTGFIISWIGMSASILISFVNARFLFRNAFSKKFGGNKYVSMIENYSLKYGLIAVIVLRILFFIPYNLQNIAFGLSKIRTIKYMTGAVIGILPITVFYSILGDALNFQNYDPEVMKTRVIIFAVFAVFLSMVFIAGVIIKNIFRQINN